VIGDRPRRREDLRFLTGRGSYLDDLAFDRLAHAVVLRSVHAHSRIRGIDPAAARATAGVLAVLTAAEVRADGLQPLQPSARANVQTGEPFAYAPQPLLAEGKVRYVGEPVALIVAETRAQALGAAEQVVVDYAPLPSVTTLAACGAGDFARSAGQSLPRLAYRRRGGRRCGVRGGGSCGRAQPR
jgi:carbon-monoxide dehydrogenase large subunit